MSHGEGGLRFEDFERSVQGLSQAEIINRAVQFARSAMAEIPLVLDADSERMTYTRIVPNGAEIDGRGTVQATEAEFHYGLFKHLPADKLERYLSNLAPEQAAELRDYIKINSQI